MCGLFGLISSADNGFTNDELEAFKMQGWLNQFRGTDSSGVVQIHNKTADYRVLRTLGPFVKFNQLKHWDDYLTDIVAHAKIAFGHGRAATQGTVTIENAHPFLVKNKETEILLAHNGTLTNSQSLPGFHKADVDSKWLAEKLIEHGPAETFGKVRGPIATIWWNRKEKSFNVYRNHERPLHWVRGKHHNRDIVLLTSEMAPLAFIKYKFGFDYKMEDIKEFEPEHMYTFHWDEIYHPEKQKIAMIYTPVPQHGRRNHQNQQGWFDRYDDDDDTLREWMGLGYKPQSPLASLESKYSKEELQNLKNFEDIYNIDIDKLEPYQKRLLEMLNGNVAKISWADNQLHVTHTNGSMYFMPKQPPPDPHLKDITMGSTKDLLKKHLVIPGASKEVIDRTEYVNRAEFLATLPRRTAAVLAKQASNDEPESSILLLPQRGTLDWKKIKFHGNLQVKPAQVIKWHSKQYDNSHKKVTLHHKAFCEPIRPYYFSVYRNGWDGVFTRNQPVIIEPFQYEQKANVLHVTGFLWDLQEKPNRGDIEFTFWTAKWDQQSLSALGPMLGYVTYIKLNTIDEYEENKCYIEINLNMMAPMSDYKMNNEIIEVVNNYRRDVDNKFENIVRSYVANSPKPEFRSFEDMLWTGNRILTYDADDES